MFKTLDSDPKDYGPKCHFKNHRQQSFSLSGYSIKQFTFEFALETNNLRKHPKKF